MIAARSSGPPSPRSAKALWAGTDSRCLIMSTGADQGFNGGFAATATYRMVRVDDSARVVPRRAARVELAGDGERSRRDGRRRRQPLRLPARGVGEGAGRGLRAPGPHVRRAAGAHHAAGRGHGRGRRRCRLRSGRLAGLLRHQQRRGQPQSPVSQSGEWDLHRCRRTNGRGRREPARHRRVDGCGLGRLRQRWLGRSVPLSLRRPGALSQRSGRPLRRGRRSRRASRSG